MPSTRPKPLTGRQLASIKDLLAGVPRDERFNIVRGDEEGHWHAVSGSLSVTMTEEVADKEAKHAVFIKHRPKGATEEIVWLKLRVGDLYIYARQGHVIVTTKELNA